MTCCAGRAPRWAVRTSVAGQQLEEHWATLCSTAPLPGLVHRPAAGHAPGPNPRLLTPPRQVTVASVEGSREVECARKTRILADTLISDCESEAFDLIALPVRLSACSLCKPDLSDTTPLPAAR